MTGARWTSYESRLPGFKVLVVPEAEAWEYEAPAWLIDSIIADHAKAALLDDSTARIADLERERDELRRDWLERTQLLDDAVKALEAANADAEALARALARAAYECHNSDDVTHFCDLDECMGAICRANVAAIAAHLARIRPPEAPQA